MRSERNFGLDLARAIAIGLVLLAHFFQRASFVGSFGVELFFVLSGFLVGGILLRSLSEDPQFASRSLMKFWTRRWFRTLPDYFLFVGVNLVLGYLLIRPTIDSEFWRFLFFFQNIAQPKPWFFGESWSLAVEEWFYFLLPLSVYIVMRLPGFQLEWLRKRSFDISLGTFLLVPLLLRLFFFNSTEGIEFHRTAVIFRLDAILYGVLIARLRSSSLHHWIWNRSRWFGNVGGLLLLVCAAVEAGMNTGLSPGITSGILLSTTPIAFACILPWFEKMRIPSGITTTWIQNISRWSYSIYLCHLPVFMFIQAKLGESFPNGISKILLRSFSLGIVIAVSALIYKKFENPLTGLREKVYP